MTKESLNLPEELILNNLAECYEPLCKEVERIIQVHSLNGDDFECCVDGSKVKKIDISGFQMILSLIKTLEGKKVVVQVDLNKKILNFAKLIGVSKFTDLS